MKKYGMSQDHIQLVLQWKLQAKRFVNETFDVCLLFVCGKHKPQTVVQQSILPIFHRGSVGASAQLQNVLEKWKISEWLKLKITDAMELK